MEYKIKAVDIEANYNKLLIAYYGLFESIYGKYPTSYIIHRKLNNKSQIHPSYAFMDSNLGFAQEAIISSVDNHDIVMIGAYDANDILSAVSRIRRVIEPSGAYVCISELLPIVQDNLNIVTDVIKSIESSLKGYNVGDYLSFEVPIRDTNFQNGLLSLGYDLVPTDKEQTTVLYDKKLEKDLSLK